MPNAEQLLYQTGKSSNQSFSINKILKYFAIFPGKHRSEIFKNTYLEEHLWPAASQLTLPSDCLEIVERLDCFWIATKTQ